MQSNTGTDGLAGFLNIFLSFVRIEFHSVPQGCASKIDTWEFLYNILLENTTILHFKCEMGSEKLKSEWKQLLNRNRTLRNENRYKKMKVVEHE